MLQGTQARLEQAQAENQRSSGIASLATAHKTQYEMQMEAWKAQRTQELSKLMANPNVTSDETLGLPAGVGHQRHRDGERLQRPGGRSPPRRRAPGAPSVRESIDIQNADEGMRNNLANNITNYMDARTGQQNAATNAVGPMLGGSGWRTPCPPRPP